MKTINPNNNKKVRVIAGSLKNSNIFFTELDGLRPTLERHRERIFAWLNNQIIGASILDLFSGSGILGIEALSRGAKKGILVEKNQLSFKQIQSNLIRLKLKPQTIEVSHCDALKWLNHNTEVFDLIFLDPPFIPNIAKNFQISLLYKALSLITCSQSLKNGGFIYLEVPKIKKSQNLDLFLNQVYAQFKDYRLYRKKEFSNLALVLLEKTKLA